MAEETAIPRPEYPRPQFVREKWLNLNGEWEFAFDDADEGCTSAGMTGARCLCASSCRLPIRLSCPASTIKRSRSRLVCALVSKLPDEWHARDLLLNFGAVDYTSTVWVNGQEVGHNQGGHVPFPVRHRALHQARRQSTDASRRGQTGSGTAARQAVGHRPAAGDRLLLHHRNLADSLAGAGAVAAHRGAARHHARETQPRSS